MQTLLTALQELRHNPLVAALQDLGAWHYILLALLVAVEGPVVTLLGAAAAAAGLMRPDLVFVAAATGNLTADVLWYSVGYMGRTEWLVRYGRWLGVRPEHIAKLERQVRTHARRMLVLAKLTLSFSIPALIATGLARVPWRHWFPAVFAAECVWTGGLVVVGYTFALSIRQLERGLQIIVILGTVLFLAAIIRYIARHRSRRQDSTIPLNYHAAQQDVVAPPREEV